MNWSEANIHTLLTQVIATVALVVTFFHPGTAGYTVPDGVVAAVATLSAAIASGLHSLHSSAAKNSAPVTEYKVVAPK